MATPLSKEILENLVKIECEGCHKKSAHVTMTMTMGRRGYRMYPLCDACLEKAGSKPPKNSAFTSL